ncbi:MAG: type II secretion system F family protein [Amnibacterium sp.]
MTGLLAPLGLLLLLCAMLALVLMVVAPVDRRVPLERRRAPGAVPVSGMTRMTDTTVAFIQRAMQGRSTSTLAGRLELAGLRMEPAGFVLLVVCAAAVLAALGVLLGGLTLWSIPAALVLAALAPLGARIVLSVRTSRRRAAFADQLDDTLGLLSGGLRAGHSLLRSIDSVSQEMESPTREELARAVNETRIGRDLGEALLLTAQRMRCDDFLWVAQAVAITQEAGGNLSQVLDQAGRTIRERNQIRRQVKALSAEGRLSALILLLLPVAVLLLLLVIRPGYFAGFFTSIFGIAAMGAAVVLMVVGTIWMRVMVRVRF